jgi:hypothetical protein
LDAHGSTIWIVDAHGYGRHFNVLADEKLTAFLELESANSGVAGISLGNRGAIAAGV